MVGRRGDGKTRILNDGEKWSGETGGRGNGGRGAIEDGLLAFDLLFTHTVICDFLPTGHFFNNLTLSSGLTCPWFQRLCGRRR